MRARLAAFAAGCAVFAAPAQPQDQPAPPPPNSIQALDDCVSAHAKQLEISGEAADVVAQAAVAECGRELTTAAHDAGGFGHSSAREELKASMRDAALVEVVEMRAARNAPKPTPPPPPPKPARAKKKHKP